LRHCFLCLFAWKEAPGWQLSDTQTRRGDIFLKKTLAEKSAIPIFASPIAKLGAGLTHGVMVTLLILVQSFKVRILMGQQEVKSRFRAAFFMPLMHFPDCFKKMVRASTDH
jgi:hypothetical protein